MKESTNDINEIIIRYLDGSAALEEKMLLLRWLKQSDGNRDDFAVTRDLWLSCNVAAGNELEVDIALEKLKDRILLEQGRMEKESLTERKTLSVVLRWTRVAAVLLLLLGIGYGIGSWREHSVSDVIVQNQLITAKGSKGRFTLPDGSVVWLNSETKLTYPNQFTGNRRFVSLEGEAYFEVAKNPERPFIVDMGNASIRVLGTTFSVKADKGKDQITAVLLEGSIRFESPTQQVLLAPDQQLTFIRSTNKIDIQSVNAKENLAWKDGLLKYKSIALCTLLNELEKRYEIPIHIENKRLLDPNVTVSGTFSEDQSLKEILQVISRSLPIKWSQRDGTYYIQ